MLEKNFNRITSDIQYSCSCVCEKGTDEQKAKMRKILLEEIKKNRNIRSNGSDEKRFSRILEKS